MSIGCKTYTAEEAAAVLGMPVSSFRRFVRQGKAPARLFQNCWSKRQIDSLAEYGQWDAGNVHNADQVADEAFGR